MNIIKLNTSNIINLEDYKKLINEESCQERLQNRTLFIVNSIPETEFGINMESVIGNIKSIDLDTMTAEIEFTRIPKNIIIYLEDISLYAYIINNRILCYYLIYDRKDGN